MNKELKKLLEDDKKCKEAIKERDHFLKNHTFLCTTVADSELDYERFKSYFKMLPERGTIGCSLSHEKALKKFLDKINL